MTSTTPRKLGISKVMLVLPVFVTAVFLGGAGSSLAWSLSTTSHQNTWPNLPNRGSLLQRASFAGGHVWMCPRSTGRRRRRSSSLHNQNGNGGNSWFQDLLPNFLQKRQGDFVRLDESAEAFGPGPIVVLYNVPSSMDNDEFRDMIADGAPRMAAAGGGTSSCTLHRIELCTASTTTTTTVLDEKSSSSSSLLALPVTEALQQILKNPTMPPTTILRAVPAPEDTSTSSTTTNGVLFFSGFSNPEMMAVYQIMADEIYQETGGRNNVACAKAVPNAMHKPLGQVLEEICGDHQQAIIMST
jgi:hypothetical protein